MQECILLLVAMTLPPSLPPSLSLSLSLSLFSFILPVCQSYAVHTHCKHKYTPLERFQRAAGDRVYACDLIMGR